MTESNLLQPETYGKLILCLDEMFPQGIIETLDHDNVEKLMKLKL